VRLDVANTVITSMGKILLAYPFSVCLFLFRVERIATNRNTTSKGTIANQDNSGTVGVGVGFGEGEVEADVSGTVID
jgi:hypothetical protein